MRSEQETTRTVRSWLEHGVTALPDSVIDRVLDDVPTTRQRRVWQAPPGPARVLVAAAVLIAVVVGGVTFGQRIGDAIGNPTPSPGARSLVPLQLGPLEPGQYAIDTGFPVRISFDVPDGWTKNSLGADYAVLTSRPDGVPERPPSGVALGFYTVANLFADPCDLEGRMMDPPVGPTVADLSAAFSDVPGYRASVARPASIDGYPGQRVDLELQLYMCEFGQVQLWQTPTGWFRSPAGDEELSTLWIVDVDGVRLIVDATAYPGTTEEDRGELRAVVDSMRIQPADEAR
jgi:hypothetical protein